MQRPGWKISIHALREEGDAFNRHGCRQCHISIHALREEGDCCVQSGLAATSNFYPRPPRGGRRRILQPQLSAGYFYPRPPRGGRRAADRFRGICFRISIHALREEGDHRLLSAQSTPPKFLSTPSARRATGKRAPVQKGYHISIHALREEGDNGLTASTRPTQNFYPRPPRGGRLKRTTRSSAAGYFYPRPPRGGRPFEAGYGFMPE